MVQETALSRQYHFVKSTGMCVLYCCDVPSCVRNLHLSVGHGVRNNADCDAKEAQDVRGSEDSSEELRHEEVRSIDLFRPCNLISEATESANKSITSYRCKSRIC